MRDDFPLQHLCEALAEDLVVSKERGRGVDFIATHFNVGNSTVYAWMDGSRPFPLLRIGEWKHVTGGESAARWVAHQLGLAYVPMPRGKSGDISELTEVVERNAESVVNALQIYADGRVDRTEARESVPNAIASLQRCIESELALIHRLERDTKKASKKPQTLKAFELGICR